LLGGTCNHVWADCFAGNQWAQPRESRRAVLMLEREGQPRSGWPGPRGPGCSAVVPTQRGLHCGHCLPPVCLGTQHPTGGLSGPPDSLSAGSERERVASWLSAQSCTSAGERAGVLGPGNPTEVWQTSDHVGYYSDLRRCAAQQQILQLWSLSRPVPKPRPVPSGVCEEGECSLWLSQGCLC
jgi:hypothetical protein